MIKYVVLRDGPGKVIYKIRLLYLFHFGFIIYLIEDIVSEFGLLLGLYMFEINIGFSLWHTNEH